MSSLRESERRLEMGPVALGWVLGVGLTVILAAPSLSCLGEDPSVAAKRDTKANLETLRFAIDAYAAENRRRFPEEFDRDLVSGGGTVRFLRRLPEEKFTPSALETRDPTPHSGITPEDIASSNLGGWMYNPLRGEVRLNKMGPDFEGEPFFEY